MSGLTYPLIAYGAADDISGAGYTTTGTLGALTAVTDPFGGTSAYTINDTDAGVQSCRIKSGIVISDTVATVKVCWKAGTSAGFVVVLRDTTASAVRIQDNGTQSGGVPTHNMITGTNYSDISLSNGWYAFRYRTTAIVSGNSHRLELYGTDNNSAHTGSSLWYVRSFCLLDLLGVPKSFSRPRQGYEAAVSPSGTRDAWSYGFEEVLQARTSWVPSATRDTPVSVSGWYGANESAGINSGVKAMLESGWGMNLLRYAPDRTACTTYQDAYLTQPTMQWTPELEGSGERAFTMELTSPSSVFTGL